MFCVYLGAFTKNKTKERLIEIDPLCIPFTMHVGYMRFSCMHFGSCEFRPLCIPQISMELCFLDGKTMPKTRLCSAITSSKLWEKCNCFLCSFDCCPAQCRQLITDKTNAGILFCLWDWLRRTSEHVQCIAFCEISRYSLFYCYILVLHACSEPPSESPSCSVVHGARCTQWVTLSAASNKHLNLSSPLHGQSRWLPYM